MKRFIVSLSVLIALFASNAYAEEKACLLKNKQWEFNCTEKNEYLKQFLNDSWNNYVNGQNKDCNVTTQKPCEITTIIIGQKPCENTTKAITQRPTEATTEVTTQTVISRPTEATTEATTQATTQKPTEATTEVTTQATTQRPTETTTQAQNNSANKTIEQQVVDLVNKHRAENGLNPLKINSSVSRVAQAKSEDMRDKNYFDHTSPTYGSPFEMLKSFGVSYKTAGENIAKGQKTAEAVVNAWMNSEGHRKNILNANFEKIGIGYATGNGTTYWTQMFIKQ